jgi:restriction endonuclease Mrr
MTSYISGSLIVPESMGKILGIGAGNPVTLSLIAGLAKAIGPEHLRSILNGHLYDIKDAGQSEQDKLIAAAKPIVISANEAMIGKLKKQPEDVHALTPRQFEELIAELLREKGHEVTLTKATRDGGKDILVGMRTELGDFLCLVEAKRYRADRPVDVALVRTLYGTLCDHQATSAMLVTMSRFSPDAHAFQNRHPHTLSLRDQIDVARWIQQYGSRDS